MKIQMLAAVGLVLAGSAGLILSQANRPATKPSSIGSTTPAATSPAANATPDKVDPDGTLTVIGYLEKQDSVITIKSGPKGPVYSMATRDGKVLFENLSLEQARAQAPELHDFIKTGNAGDASIRVIDASMN